MFIIVMITAAITSAHLGSVIFFFLRKRTTLPAQMGYLFLRIRPLFSAQTSPDSAQLGIADLVPYFIAVLERPTCRNW